jgi:hypothetical protein
MTCVEPWIIGVSKFFLEFLQSVFVWPVAVVLIAWWFRSQLRSLVNTIDTRLASVEEASLGSLSLRLAPRQPERSTVEANVNVTEALDALDADPADLQRDLNWERAFNWIYGSQWSLMRKLHELDSSGLAVADMRKFFDEWMETRKIEKMDYIKWAQFLGAHGLIEFTEEPLGPVVRISKGGRAFVDYINGQYDPLPFRAF